MIKKINSIPKRYSKGKKCDKIGNFELLIYDAGDVWDKEWYEETIELPFEGRMYLCPKDYDKVLRKTFGNYMELPPKEKQVTHHNFVAYKK